MFQTAIIALVSSLALTLPATQDLPGGGAGHAADVLGTPEHREAVFSSRFCAGCHPAIYEEHRQNTHGLAFHDEEARLATRGFRREDCIRCHTPRPVFETGIGMTPMQRWTNLDEGNTCISCHGRSEYDYSRFVGGAECRAAFEPSVGTVEHCATCHRIAGTPDQWSRAEKGNLAGRVCVSCHMPPVMRPVAVGQPPRLVSSHLFPASRSESQLRRAYSYEAQVVGNEAVVRITNRGVGHNFPTANRQRAVESLVIVRDLRGEEVARSRLVCRYPYASELEPHQLTMPRSSQIPSGKTTEHRVPLGVPDGVVECRLYFKRYRPIADSHPELSRCLEDRRLPFEGIEPSTEPVDESPEVTYASAPADLNDFFSPAGLANVARDGQAQVSIPEGSSAEDVAGLAALLESHLPEARRRARDRLAELYPASAPELITALARWSNETFNEAKRTFLEIGAPAVPPLVDALVDERLYVRVHARELLARLDLGALRSGVLEELYRALKLPSALDRRSAAAALGQLGDRAASPELRPLLEDGDPDVVLAAAGSLARLGDEDAVPALMGALERARWPESRRGLAVSLATLGSAAGVQPLIDDLDDEDVLQREYAFSALFSITGEHFGYEPAAPSLERLVAASRIQAWWSKEGGDAAVHPPRSVDPATQERAWAAVQALGGGTDTLPGGDDDALLAELVGMGADAVPALVEGLTFPPGFSAKRALVCQALGHIGSREAAPYLAATLRDPVPAVTEWACWALESCGDAESLSQLRDYENRVPALVGAERGTADADRLLARSARTRLMLGDERARDELVGLLLSPQAAARRNAIEALTEAFGEDRGYDPAAEPDARLEAAQRWQ